MALALGAALAAPAEASASVTIGQLAPGNPPTAECTGSPFDLIQPTVTSGSTYVVPAGGVAITSWSTNAASTVGQMFEMKIFRKVADPATYRVVAHDGPHPLTPSAINTFAVNIAVQPGDVLGINDVNGASAPNACTFPPSVADTHLEISGDAPDGALADFSGSPESDRVNATALVAFKPSNSFSFGTVKRNKHKGTAMLPVTVPGPGTLSLTGKGVKTQRAGGGAAASLAVSGAGSVNLPIRAKGKSKHKLNKTGKVKVTLSVTYTPSGDLPGVPNTQTDRVKLIKKH